MGLVLPLDVSACCHVFLGGTPHGNALASVRSTESTDEAGGLSGPLFSCAVIDSEKSQELITSRGKCCEGYLGDVEEVQGRTHNQLKSMTRPNQFLTTAGSFVVALSALAVITAPAGVHADEQAKQLEQSYCFNASLADRWKPCR